MARLNRGLQLSMLQRLANVYPGIAQIKPSNEVTPEDIAANLYYLAEHGLVTVPSNLMMDGTRGLGAPAITAKGMDFLTDDGGLSAILGVITIRLHDDSVRRLLIDKVEAAPDGDQTAKSVLVAKIKSLPAEALGKLAMDGLDIALSQTPRLIELLGRLLG